MDDSRRPATTAVTRAWVIYRRMLRWMLLVMVVAVAAAIHAIRRGEAMALAHRYIIWALGVGLAMLLASALMGLAIFARAGGKAPRAGEDDDAGAL